MAGRLNDPWGDPSTIRLIAMIGAVVGAVVACAGVVLVFLNNSQGMGVVGIGTGMFTGGGLAAALHRQAEARVEVAEAKGGP